MAKKKAARKQEALAPSTTPGDPQGRRSIISLPQRAAGVVVNEDTALTQAAVWACIRVISESLAGMPWNVGKMREDGTLDMQPLHALTWLLNFQPNYETEAFPFRETLWAWALGWGNGYAEIERDFRGDPVALWQLHPSRVRPMRNPSGQFVYEVLNEREGPSYLPARDVFHLKGPSPDGLVGWSVIRMHARTIGLAMAQEENASSYNENDSTPGGILSHPKTLSDTALKHLEETWNRRHRGPKNRRTVAILEEDMKWMQTSTDPNDAQLVEQMQLTPAMICRIFRVPPHKIADLTRSTNNNIEHQDLEFVKDTLRPWAERGEGEADMKLFGRTNQGRLRTVIDMSERERGDTSAQTNHVKEMLFCGVYDVDEARRYLGLHPIGQEAGGDKRFVQSSMILLKDAGELPEPPPEPKPEAEPEPDGDDTLGVVQGQSMALIADACRRIIKRERDAANLSGDALQAWLGKHQAYCVETLQSAVVVLATCMKAPPHCVEVALRLFIESRLKSGEQITPEEAATRVRDYLMAATAAKEVA